METWLISKLHVVNRKLKKILSDSFFSKFLGNSLTRWTVRPVQIVCQCFKLKLFVNKQLNHFLNKFVHTLLLPTFLVLSESKKNPISCPTSSYTDKYIYWINQMKVKLQKITIAFSGHSPYQFFGVSYKCRLCRKECLPRLLY